MSKDIVDFLNKTGQEAGQNANSIMSALSKNPHNSEIRDAYVTNVTISNTSTVLTGALAAHDQIKVIENMIALATTVKEMIEKRTFGDFEMVVDPNE